MSNDSRNNPVHPTLEEHGFNSGVPGMTLRQYAAIKLNVPDSGEPWLDAMIEQSRRDKFAMEVMQGQVNNCTNYEKWSRGAYSLADAMIKASK